MGDPYEWEVVAFSEDGYFFPAAPGTSSAGPVAHDGWWYAGQLDDGVWRWYRATDASFTDRQEVFPNSPVAWYTDAEWRGVLAGMTFSHDRLWVSVAGPWTMPQPESSNPWPQEWLDALDGGEFIAGKPYYSFDFLNWHPAMEAGITGLPSGGYPNDLGSISWKESGGTNRPLFHESSGRWFYIESVGFYPVDADAEFGGALLAISTADFSEPWEAVAVVSPGDDDPVNPLTPDTATRQVEQIIVNGDEIALTYILYEVGGGSAIDISTWIAFGSSDPDAMWDVELMYYLEWTDETNTATNVVRAWPDELPEGAEYVGAYGGAWIAGGLDPSGGPGFQGFRYFYNITQRATGPWTEIELPGPTAAAGYLDPNYPQYFFYRDGLLALPVGYLVEGDPEEADFLGILVGTAANLQLITVDDLPPLGAGRYRFFSGVVAGEELLVYVYEYDNTSPYDFHRAYLISTTEGGGWGIALA